MADDPRLGTAAEWLRNDVNIALTAESAEWEQGADMLHDLDLLDPLRALLLADENRAVEQITEALNRHEYGQLRDGLIAAGALNPMPWEQLSDRTKRVRANQLRGHVEFVLAALREVAGL